VRWFLGLNHPIWYILKESKKLMCLCVYLQQDAVLLMFAVVTISQDVVLADVSGCFTVDVFPFIF
jgi:hypothetical protein